MSEVEKTDSEQKNMEAILTEARFKFAIKSLAEIVSLKKRKKFFFSPLNIFEILCIIYIGSESTEDVESIEKNLEEILYLSDVSKADLTQYYSRQKFSCQNKDFISLYKSKTNCWITNSKVLSKTVQHLYKGKMETVDFSTESFSDSLNQINSWLKNLKLSVKFSNITESMEIILSRALYSNLNFTFNHTNTERKFRALRSTKIDAVMNEIPYDDNLSMFLLFPTGIDVKSGQTAICNNVQLLVLKLTTEEGMAELRKMLDGDESDEYEFMKNEIDYHILNNISIKKLLKSLYLEKLVKFNEAILHRFVAKDEQLHLGDAIHSAGIKISNREIAAKAVTIFFTKSGGLIKKPKGVSSLRNHRDTFVFLIYDRNNRKILFTGVTNDDISHKILL